MAPEVARPCPDPLCVVFTVVEVGESEPLEVSTPVQCGDCQAGGRGA